MNRRMPPAKTGQFLNACLLAGLIISVFLLHIVTKRTLASEQLIGVENPLDEFSDDCDLKNWREVEWIYDPSFAKGLSEICRQVLEANTSILLQPRPLVRLQVIQHLGGKRPLLWRSYPFQGRASYARHRW